MTQNIYAGGVIVATGAMRTDDATASTSTTTGALRSGGGLGVVGDVNVGGSVKSNSGIATYSGQSAQYISSGTLVIGSVANGANVGPFNATFPVTYSSAPIVVGISQSGSGGENLHYMITPTTTGFAARAKNSGNSTGSVTMQWIAIGPV